MTEGECRTAQTGRGKEKPLEGKDSFEQQQAIELCDWISHFLTPLKVH